MALKLPIKVNYPVRKNPNMELQLDKMLCLTMGHYPSTNACKYTWFSPTGLTKFTITDKTDLKLTK